MIDVNKLASVQDKVYDRFNVNCMQYGDTYIKMVLAMAEMVVEQFPVEELTADVQETLTCWNCHMLNHAIDIIKHVDKYSLRRV